MTTSAVKRMSTIGLALRLRPTTAVSAAPIAQLKQSDANCKTTYVISEWFA